MVEFDSSDFRHDRALRTRRTLLRAMLAGIALAPLPLFAQHQPKVWRIGFLAPRRPVSLETDSYGGFPLGMRELGYVEQKNLMIEWRFAEGKLERLPGLAEELVQLKVDVLVAAGNQAITAAKKATASIPVVMGTSIDPVGSGFVESLARPGGNITGLSNLTADLSPKHLDLLRDLAPRLARAAVLVNPTNSAHPAIVQSVQAAAQTAGVRIVSVEARTAEELEAAFATMTRERAEALIVALDGFFNQQRHRIAELAVKHRLPSISATRLYAEAAGLMSYGQNIAEDFRRAATYVDKILKGAKPGDIPVEQSTKFELVINMKTANALGIKIPNSILVRADKVIE